MWSHEVVDVLTGERIMPLVLSANSWQIRLNGQVGSGESTVPTRDPVYAGVTASMWRSLRQSWTRAIVGRYNDDPVWAHVITGSSYNVATGVLSLQHAEIGELLRRRLFFGAQQTYVPNRWLEFGGYTRTGMLVAVAQYVVGGGAGSPPSGTVSPWRLPVWFNTSPAAGGWTRSTAVHHFERPWQWMTEITEEEGGPDFCFEPGFMLQGTETNFQWVFHVGAPLNRSTHEFQIGVPESPVVDPVVSVDGSQQQTGVFVLGEGRGSARPVGVATPSDGLVRPAMDVALSMGQEASASALNTAARGYLAAFRQPAEVWSLGLRADAVLRAMHGDWRDGVRPGSRIRLRFDDPVVGTGVQELYVTGMSGDLSGLVQVEVMTL